MLDGSVSLISTFVADTTLLVLFILQGAEASFTVNI